MRKYPSNFQSVWLLLVIATHSACLQVKKEPLANQRAQSSDVAPLGESATNLDGTRVSLTWPKTGAWNSVQIQRIDTNGSPLTVATVPYSLGQYTESGLTPSTLYYYQINYMASNSSAAKTSNLLSAYTFSGVANVSSANFTGATLSFLALGGSVSTARVYCRRSKFETSDTLIGTITAGNQTIFALTNLSPGSTYLCRIKAVLASGAEDGNSSTVGFSTLSYTQTSYLGILGLKAFGDSTITSYVDTPVGVSAPVAAKQVQIRWYPFANSNFTTEYKLIRVARGGVLDTSTTTLCSPTVDTACSVCTTQGNTVQTCTDTAIATAPKAYEYAVVQSNNGVPEEVTPAIDSALRILVHIPPRNMALVQRDAANNDMCRYLRKTPDPYDHMSCAYASGVGAVPVNTNPGGSALSFPTGKYDFGYNLLVDRFEAACNWSPGACSTGDCYGNSNPTTLGVTAAEGTVFYSANDASVANHGMCWIRSAGIWKNADDVSLSSSEYAKVYTADPDANFRKPPLGHLSVTRAWGVCQSQNAATYGPKRLLRRREFVTAAAYPTVAGEPGAMSDTDQYLRDGGSNALFDPTLSTYRAVRPLSTTQGCNSNRAYGLNPASTFNTNSVATTTGGRALSVVIGSYYTQNCTSRYGIQDMTGNVAEFNSDNANFTNGQFMPSALDSGNTDLNHWTPFCGNSAALCYYGGQDSAYTTYSYNYPANVPANHYQYFQPTVGMMVHPYSNSPIKNDSDALVSILGHARYMQLYPGVAANQIHGGNILYNPNSGSSPWVYLDGFNQGGNRPLSGGGSFDNTYEPGRYHMDMTRIPYHKSYDATQGTNYSSGFRCGIGVD